MINIKKHLAYGSASLALLLSASSQAKTTIDVMALYSPAVTSSYGSSTEAETTIQHMINVANGIYSDSPPSDVELRLVHSQESSLLNDSDATGNVLYNSASNSTIQALRNEHGADIVALYRPYRSAESGLCGTAYLVGQAGAYQASGAYAHVSLGGICPSYITAHELGHNQGLSHSHRQDDQADGSTDSYLPYSLGHGVDNNFVTIMSYSQVFNTYNTVYKHSSPDLDCNGSACGIAPGEEGEAHAVLALTKFSPNVANYRDTKHVDEGTGGDSDGDTTDGDGTDEGTETASDLDKAKQDFDDAKAAFLLVKEEYLAIRNIFRDKKDSFIEINTNYRAVRKSYRRGKATEEELNVALAARTAALEEKNAARTDLIDYRDATYLPARQAYIDARNIYRQLKAAS